MGDGIHGSKKVKNGRWTMSLAAVERSERNCGEHGTIEFTPNLRAKDTNSLKLVQIGSVTVAGGNGPLQWEGDQAPLNDMRTEANASEGVEGGYFLDHVAKQAGPRENASDPAVSPYYRDYAAYSTISQNGHKNGKDIEPASLYDFAGWVKDCTYDFETVAKAADHGAIYGAVKWGFCIEDRKVKDEHWRVDDTQSATFDAALDEFDEHYRNPGSSTAPQDDSGGSWL